MATTLFGCFKRADVHDPDTFIVGVTALFCLYPVDVVRFVCDPTAGLPIMCDWLPTLKEIKEACDREVSRLEQRKRAEQFQRRVIQQPRHNDTFDPPENKLTKEKYGANWGLNPNAGPDTKPSSASEPYHPPSVGEIVAPPAVQTRED